MAWLLFVDESGHDHSVSPYEVRGGVALHVRDLWPFEREMTRLELECFGAPLRQYRTEVKGAKLLEPRRFKWAAQAPAMDAAERRKHCRSFLTKGLEKLSPTRPEFTAMGQASLEMARGVLELLRDREARLFACAIPRGTPRQPAGDFADYLRKDHVFLFERFFYFLEGQKQHGVIVMDESDKASDRRFIERIHAYFTKSFIGRQRTAWILPTPLFVASDMNAAVQAADLCMYCINWGFRLPGRGMNNPTRPEVADQFGPLLHRLQFIGEGYRDGEVFKTYGIVYVPDLLDTRAPRLEKKKDPTPLKPPESRF